MYSNKFRMLVSVDVSGDENIWTWSYQEFPHKANEIKDLHTVRGMSSIQEFVEFVENMHRTKELYRKNVMEALMAIRPEAVSAIVAEKIVEGEGFIISVEIRYKIASLERCYSSGAITSGYTMQHRECSVTFNVQGEMLSST